MSKRKITVGVVTIILLVVGSVWAFRSRTDPQVEKVKQMINEKTPPEQRRQRWEQVRQEMDKLSPEQRDQVRGQMREGFQRRMDEQIKGYFTLPPKDRIAYLDKQINEMEKWRKERESATPSQAKPPAQGGAGGGDSRVAPGPADKAPVGPLPAATPRCSGATRDSTTPPPSSALCGRPTWPTCVRVASS